MLRRRLAPWLARLDALDSRERYALIALSAALLLALLYAGLWAPLNDYVERSEQERARQLGLLQYFKATEAEARVASRAQDDKRLQGQSLLREVSRSARAVGINPSRLQPDGSQAVSVWYDLVAFTALMRWLEQLQATQGIEVRQLTLEQANAPGLVSARLTLGQ